MKIDANLQVVLELLRLGISVVRSYRERHGAPLEAEITANEVLAIRISRTDDAIAAGRASVTEEEEP